MIFNIDKLNLRLVKISQYLSNFNFFVRYKFEKLNIISNIFFKLFKIKFETFLKIFSEFFFNVFYNHVVENFNS